MDAERRTRKTEPPPIQRTKNAGYESLSRKALATLRTDLQLDRALHWLPWTAEGSVRATCETPFPATQVEPNSVHVNSRGEWHAAHFALFHDWNVSSIAGVASIGS